MKKYVVLRCYESCEPDVEVTTDSLDDARTFARIKGDSDGSHKYAVCQLLEEE